jgi:feruloyl-CoA synthase
MEHQVSNLTPLFLSPDIKMQKTNDGCTYLESNLPEPDYPESMLDHLYKWAQATPDAVFIAERNIVNPDLWDTLTFSQFLLNASKIASALKDTKLSVDRPLMLLSGNSVTNALMTYAGYLLGVPVVPVSPAYSLLSKTYDKVIYIQELTNSAVVFVEQTAPYSGALAAMQARGLKVISNDALALNDESLCVKDILAKELPSDFKAVSITADTPAKILFTSGSTGMPKGVVNSHRMMASNQEMISAVWPFINDRGHQLLEWLPWHHTFGGNHNFNMMLRTGGSLYIDGGKPAPGALNETLRNLMDVSPTAFFNVSVGYELLATELEHDEALAKSFFKNLRLMFFAGSTLAAPVMARWQKLIQQYANYPVVFTSSWGQTETAPACTMPHFDRQIPNCIGVPLPGLKVKLAPVGDLLELRVKGPNIMTHYLNAPEKTAEAFDEEGYLCSGDAVEMFDENDPNWGLVFKGRVSENFKLMSGSWVNVGELRLAVLNALSPLCSEAVVCGHNENYVAMMFFLNEKQALKFIGEDTQNLSEHPALVAEITRRLSEYNSKATGSSRRVKRAVILADQPSFEKGEITDKGYLNQRGTIKNRAVELAKLYAEDVAAGVIVP